jgi:uncharacterized protein YprB with RNaseH-like and TPR domain
MSRKRGFKLLKGQKIQEKWKVIDSQSSLTTKQKLEKLVKTNLRRSQTIGAPTESSAATSQEPFIIKDFSYPLGLEYRGVCLGDWQKVTPQTVSILANESQFCDLNPLNFLYFDTETTGLAGGTGTIPFMLGFGYIEQNVFRVKIFILGDLSREGEFLEAVDSFLEDHEFSATVTFNGKTFDFPLMETRYILQRKRFPLLKKPHLDFLFPARILWKNTYESRKLSYLGDVLLGISRDDDVDPSQIPMLYFDYLRTNSFERLEKVIEHNALDLLGLSALLLLAIHYLEEPARVNDEGELLGLAMLYEKTGALERAKEIYEMAKESATREEVITRVAKRLSTLKKKEKLYDEALDLWQIMYEAQDPNAYRELSIHFEHREKNYLKALEIVNAGLQTSTLTETRRLDLEKRLQRLQIKIKKISEE